MKTLLLLRHAKSSWSDPTLPDHDRPLAPRGRKAAPRMGALMRERGHQPDLILCSPAARTRETLSLLGSVGQEVPVIFDPVIYDGEAEELLERIRRLEPPGDTLLVIGHNPTLEDLAGLLVNTDAPGDTEALARLRDKFPTAALAVLEADAATWAGVDGGGLRLASFTRPRDL